MAIRGGDNTAVAIYCHIRRFLLLASAYLSYRSIDVMRKKLYRTDCSAGLIIKRHQGATQLGMTYKIRGKLQNKFQEPRNNHYVDQVIDPLRT